jgi:hypothetical protein
MNSLINTEHLLGWVIGGSIALKQWIENQTRKQTMDTATIFEHYKQLQLEQSIPALESYEAFETTVQQGLDALKANKQTSLKHTQGLKAALRNEDDTLALNLPLLPCADKGFSTTITKQDAFDDATNEELMPESTLLKKQKLIIRSFDVKRPKELVWKFEFSGGSVESVGFMDKALIDDVLGCQPFTPADFVIADVSYEPNRTTGKYQIVNLHPGPGNRVVHKFADYT